MSNKKPTPTFPTRGPRLDASRDEAIQAATVSLLAEVGYDAMSIEAIAARAGTGKTTIYRRWPDKATLVVDTVRSHGAPQPEAPDSGSLRGDLRSLFLDTQAGFDREQNLDHLIGALVAMRSHPELAALVREQLVTVWAHATHEIVQRAIARGEIPPRDADSIEHFSAVGSSMITLRMLMGEPIDAAFITRLVDETLLPILRQQ
jgi:AcrR family transcriptional regulator